VKTKGRDSYFGLHVGRPFYIHSGGFKGKVVEVISGRNLALRSFVRNKSVQMFFLDARTKTIKSQQYKDKSWDIANSG
jgi:uncharacterized UPF0146 family protein